MDTNMKLVQELVSRNLLRARAMKHDAMAQHLLRTQENYTRERLDFKSAMKYLYAAEESLDNYEDNHADYLWRMWGYRPEDYQI